MKGTLVTAADIHFGEPENVFQRAREADTAVDNIERQALVRRYFLTDADVASLKPAPDS